MSEYCISFCVRAFAFNSQERLTKTIFAYCAKYCLAVVFLPLGPALHFSRRLFAVRRPPRAPRNL